MRENLWSFKKNANIHRNAPAHQKVCTQNILSAQDTNTTVISVLKCGALLTRKTAAMFHYAANQKNQALQETEADSGYKT